MIYRFLHKDNTKIDEFMSFHRTKKRLNSTMVPLPADLNPTGDPEVSRTLRRNMFFAELKDSNNR